MRRAGVTVAPKPPRFAKRLAARIERVADLGRARDAALYARVSLRTKRLRLRQVQADCAQANMTAMVAMIERDIAGLLAGESV